MEAETGLSYTVGPVATTIYPATGITVDWAYDPAYMNIKYSYTNELRDQGLYGFELPPDQIDPSGREMYEFHAAVARDLMQELNVQLKK